MWFSLAIIASKVSILGSVNPREVSSTNASMSRLCYCEELDDRNVMRSGTILSNFFISTTTSVNQADVDAPLPSPASCGNSL